MPAPKLPLYLVHGRLGAGKTTLIAKLASVEPFRRAYVIENEFAPENIDAETLGAHFDADALVGISGGCICCSSGAELLEALQKIAEKAPEGSPVIIETTGVADSAQLLKQLFLSDEFHERYFLARNILVLDALESGTGLEGTSALDIRLADVVVLTKSDVVGPEKVAAIKNTLEKINPKAESVVAERGVIDAARLRGVSAAEAFFIEHISDIADTLAEDHASTMDCRVIPARRPTDGQSISDHLAVLRGRGIDIRRVKGKFADVQGVCWRVEHTPHQTLFEPAAASREPKLVVIGARLPDDLFGFIS
jgi:G3E family GTPase